MLKYAVMYGDGSTSKHRVFLTLEKAKKFLNLISSFNHLKVFITELEYKSNSVYPNRQTLIK